MSKLDDLDRITTASIKSRKLFSWLCDDEARASLYKELVEKRFVLAFQSRADIKQKADDPSQFQQQVFLLTAAAHVRSALTDTDSFSNAPYRMIGSGTFMLGLDGADHDKQRSFAQGALPGRGDQAQIMAIAAIACQAASVLPLKSRYFDVAELAEQAAFRFAGLLFGFAQSDHLQLELTLRKAYRGLNYIILGRHFVSEPLAVPEATAMMGSLLTRTAALIDMYNGPVGAAQTAEWKVMQAEQEELKRLVHALARKAAAEAGQPEPEQTEVTPVLKRLAVADGRYSSAERAVMAVGLLVGMVGNIQGAVAMAVQDHLEHGPWPDEWTRPNGLDRLVTDVLRRRPPAAFLPRVAIRDVVLQGSGDARIPKGSLVLLAMGADPDTTDAYDWAFGGSGPGSEAFVHSCVGRHLAMPVVREMVRSVLSLPGLAQTLDPQTGETRRLEKQWGFKVESYRLQFDRDAHLIQHPLNVVMQVKAPVATHAEALKQIIRVGAPRIELKLGQARHVHFAWFRFMENDTKLALMTVFDGDFDSYIEHFALQLGPLFDRLFEHIEDAPPQPTQAFPKEFVDTIRRYNVPPVADYFFSAYPRTTTSQIGAFVQASAA